jgi:hypothetical protein
MDVKINYINGRTKLLSNIEQVEFDVIFQRFYYWETVQGGKMKGTSLKLIRDIKINRK